MRRLLPLFLLGFLLAAGLAAQNALEQAEQAFREGDLDRATALARQALSRDPNAFFAHMILGVAAARQEQWSTATRHFQAVVRLQPSNPHGYFYLGQAKLYQHQWEAAIQNFTKALERNYPEQERLLVELALAQSEAGRPQQALASLSKVRRPADERLRAQYHAITAVAKAKLNQPAAAIEAVRLALEVDDSNPEYWDLLISALIKTDQSPQALAEAIRAQRKFPDRPDIQFLFAMASYYVPESPLNKLALRNLQESEPDSPRVLLAEGLLYRKQGRNKEATDAFQKAAQRGAPDAHLLLGIVHRENGEYDAAEQEYREAERLNPENGQVMLELGKLSLTRGDLPQAQTRLEKAAHYMPETSAVHYQLGLLYRRLGQTEKAEHHFRISRQFAAPAAAQPTR